MEQTQLQGLRLPLDHAPGVHVRRRRQPVLWITFAPITGAAARYYGVSDLSIGLLSLIFMLVYIIVSIPASWTIDTYGIRVAVGIGAVLTGVFGLLRGVVAQNYTLVLVCQIGIAVGQPFILNAVTTVAARWFPMGERATASGLGSLAIYLGILVGLVLTPYLMIRYGIGSMLLIYGIVAAVAALRLLRIRPRAPADASLPAGPGRALPGLRRPQAGPTPDKTSRADADLFRGAWACSTR